MNNITAKSNVAEAKRDMEQRMSVKSIRNPDTTVPNYGPWDYFYRFMALKTHLHLVLVFAFTGVVLSVSGQRVLPPSHLANDLCSCMGDINPASDDRSFDLAVRHCLNTALMQHSGEVIEILHRFPDQDQRIYLLGLLLGGALDRSCPQYPLIKERLLELGSKDPRPRPST